MVKLKLLKPPQFTDTSLPSMVPWLRASRNKLSVMHSRNTSWITLLELVKWLKQRLCIFRRKRYSIYHSYFPTKTHPKLFSSKRKPKRIASNFLLNPLLQFLQNNYKKMVILLLAKRWENLVDLKDSEVDNWISGDLVRFSPR